MSAGATGILAGTRVAIHRLQLGLECVVKELMPMAPQEPEQLGEDAPHVA